MNMITGMHAMPTMHATMVTYLSSCMHSTLHYVGYCPAQQTFPMQDFEALTPNLLARTIETVEGGGIVILLLSTLTSLTQLFSLTMDVHARLRTESHQDVTGALLDIVMSKQYCQHALLSLFLSHVHTYE